MYKRALALFLCILLGVLPLCGCEQQPPTASLRVMSWNILNPSWGGLPVSMRCEAMFDTLVSAAPDIAGIQEASSSWHEAFAELPAPYAMLCDKTDGGKDTMTMFLYNTDTLTVVESGIEDIDPSSDIRVVSWAVMESIDSGARFLITNTHPDSREAECLRHTERYLTIARQLSAEWGLPALAVGDFNALESSAAYALSIADGFTDCKYADGVELVKDIDSYLQGDYGGFVTTGKGSRDHIFFKGTVTPTRFETLYGDTVQSVSDHLPVIADVTVINQAS